MSSTAHASEAELVEHFDPPEVLADKLDTLAAWVQQSRYFMAFTGAGISTSAGIPDFRGPDGIWTLASQGKKPELRDYSKGTEPTVAHMSLVALVRAGIMKHIISTNTDGLHRKSGLRPDELTELHGNANLEDCPVQPIGLCGEEYAGGGCGQRFFRDGPCRVKGNGAHEHATGRVCPECGNPLQDTHISFNETLRAHDVESAHQRSSQADLMLSIGSSLRVSTWAMEAAQRNGRVVVCNLQWTPFDDEADLVIHARSDLVVAGLLERLGLQPPAPYRLTRHVIVNVRPAEHDEVQPKQLKMANAAWRKASMSSSADALQRLERPPPVAVEVSLTDCDFATPYAFAKALVVDGPGVPGTSPGPTTYFERSDKDKSKLQLCAGGVVALIPAPGSSAATLTIQTTGRHGEPHICLQIDLSTKGLTRHTLEFDGSRRDWNAAQGAASTLELCRTLSAQERERKAMLQAEALEHERQVEEDTRTLTSLQEQAVQMRTSLSGEQRHGQELAADGSEERETLEGRPNGRSWLSGVRNILGV